MKENIIIVEDEIIITLDIERMLLKEKFNVLGIFDSHNKTIELIKIANSKKLHINLILMDININGAIDGIQSCYMIFKKYKIPTIFVSIHSEENTLQMIKDSHAIGYIKKPIKYQELLLLIYFNLKKRFSI